MQAHSVDTLASRSFTHLCNDAFSGTTCARISTDSASRVLCVSRTNRLRKSLREFCSRYPSPPNVLSLFRWTSLHTCLYPMDTTAFLLLSIGSRNWSNLYPSGVILMLHVLLPCFLMYGFASMVCLRLSSLIATHGLHHASGRR
jgi:hypothetical protein